MGCEEPPWDVRNENLFKCSRSHDHAHIYCKTSKIFFFGTKRLMTLKLGILSTASGTRVLPMFSYDPGLTLTIFMAGSNVFPNASAWVKAYTQLSANAFPRILSIQVSDTGPMVLWLLVLLKRGRFIVQRCIKIYTIILLLFLSH